MYIGFGSIVTSDPAKVRERKHINTLLNSFLLSVSSSQFTNVILGAIRLCGQRCILSQVGKIFEKERGREIRGTETVTSEEGLQEVRET